FHHCSTTRLYTLSLHDALPISWEGLGQQLLLVLGKILEKLIQDALGWSLVIFWLALCLFGINWKKAWAILAQGAWAPLVLMMVRSEEHTSELQSRFDLVCRLLL